MCKNTNSIEVEVCQFGFTLFQEYYVVLNSSANEIRI